VYVQLESAFIEFNSGEDTDCVTKSNIVLDDPLTQLGLPATAPLVVLIHPEHTSDNSCCVID
jgi:hypothetical protein